MSRTQLMGTLLIGALVNFGCKDSQSRSIESRNARTEATTGANRIGQHEGPNTPADERGAGKMHALGADVHNDSERHPGDNRPSEVNDTTGKRVEAEATFVSAAGSKLHGTAELKEVSGGVEIQVDIEDAPAGNKAVDIYRTSDCARLLGEGAANQEGPAGIGQIHVDEDGDAELTVVVPAVHLEGQDTRSLAQRSIVIHDGSGAGGAARGTLGRPIACAVIQPS